MQSRTRGASWHVAAPQGSRLVNGALYACVSRGACTAPCGGSFGIHIPDPSGRAVCTICQTGRKLHIHLALYCRPNLFPGGGGGWHKASVFGCLPLAAPIGLSPLLILTLCGPQRVLVVSPGGGGGESGAGHGVGQGPVGGCVIKAERGICRFICPGVRTRARLRFEEGTLHSWTGGVGCPPVGLGCGGWWGGGGGAPKVRCGPATFAPAAPAFYTAFIASSVHRGTVCALVCGRRASSPRGKQGVCRGGGGGQQSTRLGRGLPPAPPLCPEDNKVPKKYSPDGGVRWIQHSLDTGVPRPAPHVRSPPPRDDGSPPTPGGGTVTK